MTNVLTTYLNNHAIGELRQVAGAMEFQYFDSASAALSLSLPLRREPYDHESCFPYFDGLLPEGSHTRQSIAKRFGANPNNSFSLLRAIGRDCAGAVSFYDPDSAPTSDVAERIEYREIDEQELAKHIRDLPNRPLFADIDGIRLSLAGAQSKAAVCLIDKQIALPRQGTPTTHILKPLIPGAEDSIVNEYLCMATASRIDIPTPRVSLGSAANVPFLLVERYDREVKEQLVRRVHQEDFCQALGIRSSAKYQADDGPSLQNCFELLKRTIVPAVSFASMMDRVVFNFLIGNRDAHAKNYSLLHRTAAADAARSVLLAPIYDVMCTEVYLDVNQKMAMKIGQHYKAGDVFPRHWQRLCEEVGFSFPSLVRLIDRLSIAIPSAVNLEINASGINSEIAQKIERFVLDNCSLTRKRFDLR